MQLYVMNPEKNKRETTQIVVLAKFLFVVLQHKKLQTGWVRSFTIFILVGQMDKTIGEEFFSFCF